MESNFTLLYKDKINNCCNLNKAINHDKFYINRDILKIIKSEYNIIISDKELIYIINLYMENLIHKVFNLCYDNIIKNENEYLKILNTEINKSLKENNLIKIIGVLNENGKFFN